MLLPSSVKQFGPREPNDGPRTVLELLPGEPSRGEPARDEIGEPRGHKHYIRVEPTGGQRSGDGYTLGTETKTNDWKAASRGSFSLSKAGRRSNAQWPSRSFIRVRLDSMAVTTARQ